MAGTHRVELETRAAEVYRLGHSSEMGEWNGPKAGRSISLEMMQRAQGVGGGHDFPGKQATRQDSEGSTASKIASLKKIWIRLVKRSSEARLCRIGGAD